MGRRRLKYKTASAYGTRKRKSPTARRSTASSRASSTSDVQQTDAVTDAEAITSCAATTVSDAIEEALPSTSYAVETSRARGSDDLSALRSASSKATSRIAHMTDSNVGTSSDGDSTSSTGTWSSGDLAVRLAAAAEASRYHSARISGSHLDTSGDVSVPSTSSGRRDEHSAPRSTPQETSRSARIAGSHLDTSGDVSMPSTSSGRRDELSARCPVALHATGRCSTRISGSDLGTSGDVSGLSTSTGRTIQAHLQPRFVSSKEAQEVAAKVQARLSSTPATARKMELTGEGEALASAEPADEFLVVQVTALNFFFSGMLNARSAPNQDFQFIWVQGMGWQHECF